MNPFAAAAGFNTSPPRRKTFAILADLIDASCMEPLDELRETRKLILASSAKVRLQRTLGEFPFDQKHAIQIAERWRKLPALDRLREQRELAESFRREYAELRQAAEREQSHVR